MASTPNTIEVYCISIKFSLKNQLIKIKKQAIIKMSITGCVMMFLYLLIRQSSKINLAGSRAVAYNQGLLSGDYRHVPRKTNSRLRDHHVAFIL